jgi:hypothetical protein
MKELGAKVGSLGIGHIFVAGATKVLEERLQSGIIGNNTLMSGAIKLVEALAISWVAKDNTWGKAVAIGFGVDAVEDIVTSLIGGAGVSAAAGSNGGLI